MVTASAVNSSSPGWDHAWADALAELELDVERAEQLLTANQTPAVENLDKAVELLNATSWQPPAGLGPLPVEFADRARHIVKRQLNAITHLQQTMVGNRQQAAVTAKIEVGDDGGRPLFVDRCG